MLGDATHAPALPVAEGGRALGDGEGAAKLDGCKRQKVEREWQVGTRRERMGGEGVSGRRGVERGT